jgi:hypothetical protein
MTGSNPGSDDDAEGQDDADGQHVVRRLTVSILVLLLVGVGTGTVVALLVIQAVSWLTGL